MFRCFTANRENVYRHVESDSSSVWEDCMRWVSACYESFSCFKAGKNIDQKIQDVDDKLITPMRIAVREIAEEISINIGSCREILTRKLNVHCFSVKFVA